MAVRTGVDEQDPMEDLVESVEEVYETEGAEIYPHGTAPYTGEPYTGVPQGGPYKPVDPPMTYLDTEATDPPPTRGDTR